MRRFIYEKLVEWKNRNKRKPLIVDGVTVWENLDIARIRAL